MAAIAPSVALEVGGRPTGSARDRPAHGGVIIDSAEVFNNQLREWEDYYGHRGTDGDLGRQAPTNASTRNHGLGTESETAVKAIETGLAQLVQQVVGPAAIA